MSRIDKIRAAIRRRKHNREAHKRKHQGARATREAHAIRKLRKRLAYLLRPRPEVMFDSVTISAIPKDAKAVAGYVNGNYVTVPALRRRFGRRTRIVTIAVSSDVIADVLDIEAGDATNADAVRWFKSFKQHRPKHKPIFYTSVSNADALVATLSAAGISRGSYVLWLAHYGQGRHLCGPDTCRLTSHKADSTQFTSTSHGRNLDESICRRSFWERG